MTLNSTVFGLALLAFSFLAIGQARVLPETAKLVPPETVLLVNVGNFSELKGQFEKTNLYNLYKDPAIQAFVSNTKAKFLEKMQQEDNEFARAIFNADVLPQGKVGLALVLNKQAMTAEGPPFLLITQWGQSIGKIKEVIDKVVQKAIEDGLHRKTEDYRGVTIVTMIKEPTAGPQPGSDNTDQNAVPTKPVQQQADKIHYCFIDDCLTGSTNLDALKFVIAHIKGASSPTLGDDADYSATMRAVGPYHDIDFYLNIKQIIKTILAEDTTGEAKIYTSNLGFDNVTSGGCSIGLGRRQGSSYSGKALLKIDGAKKGIFKMLEVQSASLKAPRFISASAYSVTFLNLNIRKAYNELYNILMSFSPGYAAMLHGFDMPATPDGEPAVQLKGDIIDHLGSQIIIAPSINKASPGGPAPKEEYLVALAVVNHRALEKSLSRVHSVISSNNPQARRELLGHTIYLTNLPATMPGLLPGGQVPMEAPGASSTAEVPKLAFTITNTHMILGTESTVDQAIRRLSSAEAGSLSSAKWFTIAKSAIPSVVGLANLEDNAASNEFLWRTLKEQDKSKSEDSSRSVKIGISPSSGLMFSQTGLDFDLLPKYDVVRKYFGLSASYGISRPDGFFCEFKYINPGGTD